MKKHFCLLLLILPTFIIAQQIITGTIKDNTGFPLPGTSIIVKGTDKGEVTDFDGQFTIEMDKTPATLVISYVGYIAKEIEITNQKKLDIVLEESQEKLDEVVIIGYGQVDKGDLTGSVTTVKPKEDLVNQSQNIESLLQGQAAGVLIQQNTAPGSSSTIKIRGLNSLTGNTEPLYVIDGIIVDSANEDTLDPLGGAGNSYSAPQNGITGLNPRDIQSIEVLKDASATAIYGSRGANGVIIITTKNGELGDTKFNFSTTTTIGQVVRDIDMLGFKDYVNYQNDVRASQGVNPTYYTYPDGSVANFDTDEQFMIDNAATITRLEGIDWGDDTYRESIIQNHRLSASGGGSKMKYYFAAGFIKNEGVIPNASAKTTDFTANLTNNLTSKLKLSTKFAVAFTENSASKGTSNLGGTNNSLVRQIVLGVPISGDIQNFDGETDVFDIGLDGPKAWINDFEDLSNETRLLGALKLDYKMNKTFTYRLAIGTDYRIKKRQVWFGTALRRGRLSNGEAGLSKFNRFRYNVDNTLMFKHKFNRKHKIDGTVGFIIDAKKSEFTTASATDFPLQDLGANGITSGQNQQPVFYHTEPESLLSYLGRLNYTLANRYLFTATFRADGSSKFVKGNRWAYFPAFAFAWKINKEKFLRNSETISEAKLRLGWGLTGNQAINAYQTLSRFPISESPYSDGSNGQVATISPANLKNPSLKWETTSQYNVGLDYGLFNDRIVGSVDVYYKEISDLLLRRDLPGSVGFSVAQVNQGDLINKGVEIALSADVISKENFKWNVYGNIAFNRNEISNIPFDPAQFGNETYSAYLGNQISGGNYFKVPANIFIEGQAPGLFYGYATNGIVSNADDVANAPSFNGSPAQLGDVYLVDQNGDGIINNNDLTIIGDPNPDFNYGFGTSVEYKDFKLSAFFNGVYGNEIANGNLLREGYADNGPTNTRQDAYFNAWSPSNTEGTYPRVGYDLADETGFTDRIIEDGSYLRLANVSLGYNIPVNPKSLIKNAYVAVSGQNLWLLTNYSGFDPEISSFTHDPGRVGVDWGSFPNQRSFALSLNLTF